MRPDRHRQDRLFHPSHDRHPRRRAAPARGCRARSSSSRRASSRRRSPKPSRSMASITSSKRRSHRRRKLHRPAAQARPRRRRADRDARPADRSLRARQDPALGREDPGDRRGRPHARHGLHPRCRAHRRLAVEDPPDVVLLGDDAARDQAPRRRLPDEPQGNQRHAANLARRPRDAEHRRRRGRRQARRAAPPHPAARM